jgi:3-deoxy-D-manno-octulosonic-acid transferase
MRWLVDGAYVAAAVLGSPVWLWRFGRTGKLRTDWAGRFGRAAIGPKAGTRVLLHAVSVGEINAIRLLVDELKARAPEVEIAVSATTDTGFRRATELFAKTCRVVRFPFDASWMVERFLNAVQADAVGLVELEVWPNFTAACERRRVPVAVINGRLSARSFRRYGLVRPLLRPMFRRLAHAAMQTQAYADRIVAMGCGRERVSVTGTMKWDTAEIADHVAGADELAEAMGIDRSRPLVVAGSTAPQEHALLRDAVGPGVQLLCAPRKPEWFNDAAATLDGCARRSKRERGSATGRFLLDTIGELRQAYALADVVVVGRTFVDLHGSDMIEPVALGKPVIVGPDTANFQDSVDALMAGGGLMRVNASDLREAIGSLLAQPERRRELAEKGRNVVRAHQGATARHARLLLELVGCASGVNR